MASMNVTYKIQSCSRCGKQLFKAPAGSVSLGSPLLTCKRCGISYVTDMRKEWVDYPVKGVFLLLPLIFPLIGLITSLIVGDEVIGVITILFSSAIGLCYFLVHLIQVLASKKRMKDSDYLTKLLSMGAISDADYQRYMEQARN